MHQLRRPYKKSTRVTKKLRDCFYSVQMSDEDAGAVDDAVTTAVAVRRQFSERPNREE